MVQDCNKGIIDWVLFIGLCFCTKCKKWWLEVNSFRPSIRRTAYSISKCRILGNVKYFTFTSCHILWNNSATRHYLTQSTNKLKLFPRSGVLNQKLIVLSQKFPTFYGNRSFTQKPIIFPILSKSNPPNSFKASSRSYLILSFKLCLVILSSLFPQVSQTKFFVHSFSPSQIPHALVLFFFFLSPEKHANHAYSYYAISCYLVPIRHRYLRPQLRNKQTTFISKGKRWRLP